MTSPVDIRPDHFEIVQAILREHLPGDVKVWVFGSRAEWTTKDSSDLDLAFEGKTKLNRKIMGALADAFEDSDLPYTVDIVDLKRVSDKFRKIVEEQRTPLSLEIGLSNEDSNWTETTLGEFTPFNYGKSLTVRKRNSSGQVPVFGSNGIIGYHDEAVTDRPTIVIGRKGTVGAVHFSPDPCWPIDTTFFVTGHDAELVRFKFYALGNLGLDDMNSDSAVPGLNRNAAHARELRVPDESEQRRIAHILGTLDDKIELNRRMNATLEEIARAVFKDWFVDFGPVRAKMAGRAAYLPADVWALFPERLGDDGLPEGWSLKTLDHLVHLNPKESLRRGTKAPYLNMAALPTAGSNTENAILRAYTSGTRFRNGDTLLARITPCLENGKTAYVQSLPTDAIGWGSTEFIVMRAIPPVTREYTYLLARDEAFRAYAIRSMTGTSGRQRVQTEVLSRYRLASPQDDTWPAFSLLVKPIFASIASALEESRTLAALRDTMLPGLVSGEVGVMTQKDITGSLLYGE